MVPGGGRGSRVELRSAGPGEIVEVPGGGRIVRSAAGRKDRHSKVCTAKGTRDRRVRLAAHTAIQFYDVQDRLGFDRPSKAVDWLMKMAKSAVDALDELPTWKPVSESPDGETAAAEAEAEAYDSNLLPPSMESDSIADTIKSFFPVSGEDSAASASMDVQSMQFQSYQNQDLKLSLQSLQDPMMIQSHHNNARHSHQNQGEDQQSQFPGAAHFEFGNPSIGWNLSGYGGGGSGGAGFMFIPPQNPLQQHQLLFSHGVGHSSSQFFTQGGALQSNITTSSQDPGGFSGFRIPARIQGHEEEQDGNIKPFSLSSGSLH